METTLPAPAAPEAVLPPWFAGPRPRLAPCPTRCHNTTQTACRWATSSWRRPPCRPTRRRRSWRASWRRAIRRCMWALGERGASGAAVAWSPGNAPAGCCALWLLLTQRGWQCSAILAAASQCLSFALEPVSRFPFPYSSLVMDDPVGLTRKVVDAAAAAGVRLLVSKASRQRAGRQRAPGAGRQRSAAAVQRSAAAAQIAGFNRHRPCQTSRACTLLHRRAGAAWGRAWSRAPRPRASFC